MAITPTTVNFTYKKTTAIPPGQLFTHSQYFSEVPTVVTDNLPTYLDFYDVTTTSFKVKVNAVNANTLAVGLHTEVITVQLLDMSFDPPKSKIVGNFTVNLTIEDTIVLSLAPTSTTFNFQISGTTPTNKSVAITSENSWTIAKTQAWLTLSKTSGSNSDTFEIGVVPTGLTAGNYSDTVTVDDGVTVKTVSVTFVVTDANTGTDYLYVNPNEIKFGFTIGGSIPPVKNIELNVSEAWTATLSESWLELSSTSGALGVQIITIGLKSGVDLDALTDGDYTADVTITAGSFNKTVAINLCVYDFTTEIPSNANLLFTDDNNVVKLSSGRLDTYVRMAISSLYSNTNYAFDMKLPIHNGGAKKRLGLVAKKLIGKQALIGLSDFNIFQPYNPVSINLNLHETEYYTDVIAASTAVSNLEFIKGKKPADNWLSDVARTIYVTNKATLCFSVVTYGGISDELMITGDFNLDIDVSSLGSDEQQFYTVVLPISYIESETGKTLDEGTEFNIWFSGVDINVVIRKESVDHSMVYWENKFGCFDSLELIGESNITPGYKRTIASFRKDEQTTESKIIDSAHPIDYKVNTGHIHTAEEIEMINKMLDSKNVWLQTNSQLISVIPKTTKLPVYQTTRKLTAFDLLFTNTEE